MPPPSQEERNFQHQKTLRDLSIGDNSGQMPVDARRLAQMLSAYRRPSQPRSVAELALTAFPLLLLWTLAAKVVPKGCAKSLREDLLRLRQPRFCRISQGTSVRFQAFQVFGAAVP